MALTVKLITHTPNPEILIAASARLCYRDITATSIMADMAANEAEVEQMLKILITSGHHSVLEHINFTFAIDDMSRVLSHQLVRHRVGIAYSQQSQRYTPLDQAHFVTPKSVVNKGLAARYENLMELCREFYKDALQFGVPKEDARYVLPSSFMTRMVLTVNFRQLIHMFAINTCFRSQWEFRKLMLLMQDEVRTVSPRLASELKIKCFISGYCDEFYQCEQLKGKMPKRADLAMDNSSDSDDSGA